MPATQLSEFIDLHEPALERDEVRHNLMLGILSGARDRPEHQLLLWTLGGPGQCAIKAPERAMVLGELEQAQCHRLAEETAALNYPGVLGPDQTARWFVQRAMDVGLSFMKPIAQQIHALSEIPTYPGAQGYARQVRPADAVLLADWITDFSAEAAPHDPLPRRPELEARAGGGQYWFWIVDDEPVSMAGIARRTRHCAAIAPVYTPPQRRGRGYAGSVTAAVVERIFAEGRKTACLYTDLNNPPSNRCCAKIGFKPVCNSWLYPRRTA